MNIITHTYRYLPHQFDTRYHAVLLYRNGNTVNFVCRRYKISKSSLMRWNKRFDGTKASLMDKSHRPLTRHPKSHTTKEIDNIKNFIRRNPNITLIELFAKMKFKRNYKRQPSSLFRLLRKLGVFNNKKKEKKHYISKPYHTPEKILSISIPSLMKQAERGLFILSESKALTLRFSL